MSNADTLVLPRALELLACLQAALESNSNPPAHFRLVPGLSADADISQEEDTCCSGMAWVRVDQLFPVAPDGFPTPYTQAFSVCREPSWAARMEMGVYRCVDMGTLDEVVPDANWTAAATQVLLDASAMRIAACCMQDLLNPDALGPDDPGTFGFAIQDWRPVQTIGGCCGGTMLVTMELICPEC